MTTSVPTEKKLPNVFLGKSGIKVSNICLGTLTFGESYRGLTGQCDEDLSHQIINRYVEWGGNFFDTAPFYGPGHSEEILGRWLEKQPRDNFVIATKVRMARGTECNSNNVGLSRRNITGGIDASLDRLKTNYVDLFQAHIFDDATSLEETLRTFNDLIRVGKIRYVGVCNFSGWQLQKLVDVTEKLGLNPIVSLQQQYNLLTRESEFEPFQVCKASGIGVLPWSPLKGGVLTGKVKRGVEPTEGRYAWATDVAKKNIQHVPSMFPSTDQMFDVIETAEAIGKTNGHSVAQVALRWLLQKDVVSSVIIGARTIPQLVDNLAASSGWSLTKEEMKQLDEVSSPRAKYHYESISLANTDRQNKYEVRGNVKSLDH